MTTGYLVDTDWAIHYLNGHPEIVEKLQLLKKTDCDCPSYLWRNFMKESITRAIRKRAKENSMTSSAGLSSWVLMKRFAKYSGKNEDDYGKLRRSSVTSICSLVQPRSITI